MALKFRLMFQGDEDALTSESFVVDSDGQKVRIKSESLEEVTVLRDILNSQHYDEVAKYFGFPGFILYCHREDDVVIFVLYRHYQNRHQLYERGFLKLKSSQLE